MSLPRYRPMLATRWPDPFSDPEWTFEPKWDGVRTLLYWDGSTVELVSRVGNNVTAKYPELTRFRQETPCVLDGEIVALAAGRPSFERLQSRMTQLHASLVDEDRVPVAYVPFDLLFDGQDLTGLSLRERRDRLEQIEFEEPFALTEMLDAEGEALWEVVSQRRMEGMVAKRLTSPYRAGERSPDWRKISRVLTMRGVVGGFTRGDGGRSSSFASLLVGVHEERGLRWVGMVGTGFDDRQLSAIREALDQMTVSDSPFLADAQMPADAVWVEPNLVAVVGYKEWTVAGRLRAPRFVGFTDDDPAGVTWEAEGP